MAKGTIATLKDFFGVREGETLKDFAKELKDLTEEEKQQPADGIKDESFDY